MTASPAILTNGHLRAAVHLPDPINGFYRATRFDWSGIISSLIACGHEFFGPWRDLHDPLRHDSITGLAEEFQSFPESDIDYFLAPPGGLFLRLGVGLLRKPVAVPGQPPALFQRFQTYDLVDPGHWTAAVEPTSIYFCHTARSPTGLACIYEKTLRLVPGQPTLLLEHRLVNTGTQPIRTNHYNHNFFRIGDCAPGAEMVLHLPFAVKFPTQAPDLLSVHLPNGLEGPTELSLKRPLKIGESILTELNGFEPHRSPYSMRLDHRATGASVRIESDRSLERLLFWATSKTFCPEPYIAISLTPGSQTSWTLRYTFYRNALGHGSS
jgi:hypothetical protein